MADDNDIPDSAFAFKRPVPPDFQYQAEAQASAANATMKTTGKAPATDLAKATAALPID